MTINSISCAKNSGISFMGTNRGNSPQTSPIDTAGGDFDDAMEALAVAAKALINAKKAEGAKNEALTKEKVEAKFISMQNSKPINYDDLYSMGYGISGGDNLLASCKSDKLNPAIFKGKDTVVISSKNKDESCEKLTEYDRMGRPIASIQKLVCSAFPDKPDYNAVFYKYDNDYSLRNQMTMYKSSSRPEETGASHPKAFLMVGHFI